MQLLQGNPLKWQCAPDGYLMDSLPGQHCSILLSSTFVLKTHIHQESVSVLLGLLGAYTHMVELLEWPWRQWCVTTAFLTLQL